eukprot:CAMPEP_0171416094 /NCGR_PEP_ID=MMETSP0880-20121228/39920_1 /TAXON_ID=67004 /ORGANISM="Thalassiosira weissflogii, Strain CCMP1336" /LENGTH=452 /DNA_ID=CAMNT_0011934331 /DNA_START=206 /DNA_END=1565 /DNA_ORIENTATION=+
MTSNATNPNLINIPDELLHKIFTFVANSPVLIGPSLCWMLRPLSSEWCHSLDISRSELWNTIAANDLSCDYYAVALHNDETETSKGGDRDRTHANKNKIRALKGSSLETKRGVDSKNSNDITSSTRPGSSRKRQLPQQQISQTKNTRRSTRLRPATPKESYIHSHNLLLQRTENALLELTERCHSSKTPLSLSFLQKLLREHSPIAINQRVRTGGTFLVELCRARYVSEGVILRCVRLLVGKFGANPNVPSAEIGTGSFRIVISGLLREHSPIAINQRVRTGGTLLVEFAGRYVPEGGVLRCVRLLVGKFGANPNVPSAEIGTGSFRIVISGRGNYESCFASGGRGSSGNAAMKPSTSTVGRELYPIVIAAARGMFSVVNYLLVKGGANLDVRGSSRFRLFSNQRKSVSGVNLTALEFARKMMDGEVLIGAREEDLKGLRKVISLLEKASKA